MQKGHMQFSEPIKTRCKCLYPARSAGECVLVIYGWFWFYF